MRTFRTDQLDRELQSLLIQLLGSTRWRRILLVACFLSTLGWFADGWFELLRAFLQSLLPASGAYAHVVVHLAMTLPALAFLAWMVRRAAQAREGLAFRVVSSSPGPTRALVFFLSQVNPATLEQDLAVAGDLVDAETRHQIRGPWRMPVEAIAHHLPHLRTVVFVTSSGQTGSNAVREQFREWLLALLPAESAIALDIQFQESFVPGEAAERLSGGVDFFDLEELVGVLDRIYQRLRSDGFDAAEILLDVTGGTKLASVAAASVALAEGRRFQYVSTDDYRVVCFDPQYLSDLADEEISPS